MAKTESTALAQAFGADHRSMMRGLAAILREIEAADCAAARQQAHEVDQLAGPHIQFEEEVLYPEIGRARGAEYERQLRDEHATIRNALARLLATEVSPGEERAFCEELRPAFETAVQHAESCGTLISHLKTLPSGEQERALARLLQLRELGTRWTAIPAPGAAD